MASHEVIREKRNDESRQCLEPLVDARRRRLRSPEHRCISRGGIRSAARQAIDWGPFVALWMLVTFILLLRAVKTVREQLERETAPN